MVAAWSTKSIATLHQLRVLLGKLLNISQCCVPPRFFLNWMLSSIRACPPTCSTALSSENVKDLHWFSEYFLSTNGTYIIYEEARQPVNLFINVIDTGGGGVPSWAHGPTTTSSLLTSSWMSILHVIWRY